MSFCLYYLIFFCWLEGRISHISSILWGLMLLLILLMLLQFIQTHNLRINLLFKTILIHELTLTLLLLLFLGSINHWQHNLIIISLWLPAFLSFFWILSYWTEEYNPLWFNILNRSASNIAVNTLLMLRCAVGMSWWNMLIRNIIIHKELLLEWRVIAGYLMVLNMDEITTAIVIAVVLKCIMIGLVRSWRFQQRSRSD